MSVALFLLLCLPAWTFSGRSEVREEKNEALTHTEQAASSSSNDAWIVILCLSLVFIVSGCMFSFYCCGKWIPSAICCCCPRRDDECQDSCCPTKKGEKDKLISSEEVGVGQVRPPNPLIPKKKPAEESSLNDNDKSDEDSDESKHNNKVKRKTLPTNPFIKVTTSVKRSRSPSPANLNTPGEPRSRSSSPRAPAFDVVTDPSNPLLRIK